MESRGKQSLQLVFDTIGYVQDLNALGLLSVAAHLILTFAEIIWK